MTTVLKTILIAGSTAILALTGVFSAVEAAQYSQRKGDKQHYNNGAGNHDSGKRHGKYNRRRGNDNITRRILRGVFIAGASSSCSYSYRKWQATGSRYWRSRYYDCRNG